MERRFVKISPVAEAAAGLSDGAAEAAVKVAFLVSETANAGQLWFLWDRLLLYQYMT